VTCDATCSGFALGLSAIDSTSFHDCGFFWGFFWGFPLFCDCLLIHPLLGCHHLPPTAFFDCGFFFGFYFFAGRLQSALAIAPACQKLLLSGYYQNPWPVAAPPQGPTLFSVC
jgi:hypothetical protein